MHLCGDNAVYYVLTTSFFSLPSL